MRPRLRLGQWCGADAVYLENDHLEAVMVPEWGGNLISLREASRGIEVLHTPRSAGQFHEMPVLYGMPVLFPPNRIANGEFTFEGRRYRFPITEPEHNNHEHGFLYQRPWLLDSVDADEMRVSVEFDSRLHPDVLTYFPHPFRVLLDCRLDKTSLLQRVTITNDGSGAMPAGVGFHTTFRFPFTSRRETKADAAEGEGRHDSTDGCRVAIDAARQWELDARMLPTGKLSVGPDIAHWRSGRDVCQVSLDDAYLAAREEDCRGWRGPVAVLTDATCGLKVTYRNSHDYKHWVVYNADGKQGYISVEPYTWITNAPNLPLPPELTGFRSLAPFESWTLESSLDVQLL